MHAIGINIVIGYGLSETTATVTCYPSTDFALGSVGTAIPEVSVRIGDSGEIEVSGPTVMKGYYNKPAETAAAFTADGWLRTGDAGKVARDGSLTLTERIKDLFKTSNGKYIAPQALESRLGKDPFIEQVAVIGDKRKYVTAIIIPAFEALKEYARRRRIAFRNIEELVQNTDIRAMIAERIENSNTDWPTSRKSSVSHCYPRVSPSRRASSQTPSSCAAPSSLAATPSKSKQCTDKIAHTSY